MEIDTEKTIMMLHVFCKNLSQLNDVVENHNFQYDSKDNSFGFSFEGCSDYDHCIVKYDKSNCWYTMTLRKVNKETGEVVKKDEYIGLYIYQPRELFESLTGIKEL